MLLFDFLKALFSRPKKKRKPRRRTKKRPVKKPRKKVSKKPKKKATRIVKKKKSKPKRKTSKAAVRKPKKKTAKKSPKKVKAKSRKKKAVKPARKAVSKPKEKEIGVITHYFDKISVGVVKLKTLIRIGDEVRIKGAHTDFKQFVESMQIDREDVLYAKKGAEVGLKVAKPVRENDRLYRIG